MIKNMNEYKEKKSQHLTQSILLLCNLVVFLTVIVLPIFFYEYINVLIGALFGYCFLYVCSTMYKLSERIIKIDKELSEYEDNTE